MARFLWVIWLVFPVRFVQTYIFVVFILHFHELFFIMLHRHSFFLSIFVNML